MPRNPANPQPKAEREALRTQVVQAMAAAMDAGVEAGDIKRIVVRQFPLVPKPTIYRWMAGAVRRELPGILNAQRRAEVMEEATALGPLMQRGGGLTAVVPVLAKFQSSLAAIESVLNYALGPDPTRPRNPRLALVAAAQHIRSLQQGLKIAEALTSAARVDEFHAGIIAEIERESPEMAARVVGRLQTLVGNVGDNP